MRCRLIWPVIPETIDLVHPLMKHRDDAQRAVRKYAPINIMAFIPTIEAIDTQILRNISPSHATCGNFVEPLKKAADIPLGLILTPSVARINIDVVDPPTGSFLYTVTAHDDQPRPFRANMMFGSSG